MKLKLAILVFLSSTVLTAMGQKEERERKINESEAPKQAVEWMEDAFEGAQKIQWYIEETTQSEGGKVKISYEAKLDWKGQFYSVEFDKDGEIEDIEIVYSWSALPEEVRENLREYLRSNYNKHKIQKIQIQFTGSSDDLEDAMDEEEFDDITVRYEIEYYGNNEEGKHIWEGVFDEEGKLIEKSKIKQRPTDNLNY